jgi:hypothetical protein
MKKLFLAAAAMATLAGPVLAHPPAHAPAHGWRAQQGGYDDRRAGVYDGYYDNVRYDRRYDDRRRYDSRYRSGYCRQDSNIEGTIIGGAGGALAGRAIAGRGDKTVGTVVGAALGGLLGREVDRSERRCR